jgi:hypothetical protein
MPGRHVQSGRRRGETGLRENQKGRAHREKAFIRVDDKKRAYKPTKNSRERIQGAGENLTQDP